MRLFLVLALLLTTGCGAAVQSVATEAPHAAVPVVVDETLKAGEDPHTRERIALVLATPEMQQAIAAIAKAAVVASLDEATSEGSKRQIAELTNVVAHAVAETIVTEMVPALMQGAPKDMKVVEGAVESLAARSTRAVLLAAATEIPTSVAPAVRESLARELEAPDLHKAVTGLVGDATKGVLVASTEAIAETQAQNAATGKVGLMDRLRQLVTVAWGLAVLMGALGVALGARLLQMRRRTKRYRGALLAVVARRDAEHGGDPDPERTQRILEILQ